MFDIIYDKYLEEVKSIKNSIKINQKISEICIKNCEEDIFNIQSNLDRKKLNYRTLIISISSTLEATLDQLILEYLRILNKIIPKYKDLPPKIIKNHEKKSFELGKDIERSKYRKLITSSEIITNLNSCLIGNDYKLNVYALLDRTSNYRSDLLKGILNEIGIEEVDNKLFEIFKKNPFFENKLDDKNNKFQKKIIDFFLKEIDKLSIYRNRIAHNAYLTEILGIEEIKKILNVVTIICDGLYQILKKEIFYKEIREKIRRKELIEIPTAVKTDVIGDRILELKNIEEGYFKDKIYSKKNEKFQEIKILKIIKHSSTKEQLDHIKIKNKVVLTIELDQKINKTNELYMYI